MTEIAVVIVNYNTVDLTLQGIQSVLDRTVEDANVTIHVVDNASPEGDAPKLLKAVQDRGWQDKVALHLETINHGFGRGNNVVLQKLAERLTPPDYVFLLNPDAQLKNDVLGISLAFMKDHPKAALLGAKSYNPDDPNPVIAAFRFPNLGNTLAAALSIGPVSKLLQRYHVALPADLSTQVVDWVSGAAVFARFDVLKQVGFFDPEYFLYYEEVDMMYAISQAGWECWHVAEAQVLHIEGAATEVKGVDNARPRRPDYWYDSWQYFFHKNYGRPYAILTSLVWIAGGMLNYIVSKPRRKTPSSPTKFFSDFWRGALGPLLGLKPRRRS